MKRAFLYYQVGHKHQAAAMNAMSRGLRRFGIWATCSDSWMDLQNEDFVCTWGDRLIDKIDGRPRLVLEAGYLNGNSGDYTNDRLRFISTGWNGLHGRAEDCPINCEPDRFKALDMPLAPWRISGSYNLVCDQHVNDSVAPKSAVWDNLVYMAKEERAFKYRPHPLSDPGQQPLSVALHNAATCITWSSSAAVEAIIRGVPTVTLDRGSMAWPVTSHSISDPVWLGDRCEWAYNLAYRQYTLTEIEGGIAWYWMREGLEITA